MKIEFIDKEGKKFEMGARIFKIFELLPPFKPPYKYKIATKPPNPDKMYDLPSGAVKVIITLDEQGSIYNNFERKLKLDRIGSVNEE